MAGRIKGTPQKGGRRFGHLVRIAVVLILPLLLTGCWSYKSLNDMSLVMGIGIDEGPGGEGYLLSVEIADLARSVKEGSPGSKVVESSGKTLFDAVRNAKKRLTNRLYFGNAQVVVINETIARQEGVLKIIDWIMRDGEGRETMNLIISREKTAAEILNSKSEDQSITSLEINNIIMDDNQIISSTSQVELYNAYNQLNCDGISLTLPAVRLVKDGDEPTPESYGIAAFSGDKLIGFLTPQQSFYFLIATGKARGGILTLDQDDSGAHNISLEIQKNQSKISFEERESGIAFKIETQTDVFLAEIMTDIDVMDGTQIAALEGRAGQKMAQEITALVKMVQTQLKSDIFGLGNRVFKYNYPMWRRYAEGWAQTFQGVEVEVSSRVSIKNTAFIKSIRDES